MEDNTAHMCLQNGKSSGKTNAKDDHTKSITVS